MNSSALLQIIYLTNSFYAVWCWSLLKLVVVMVLVKAGRDLEKLNVESSLQVRRTTLQYCIRNVHILHLGEMSQPWRIKAPSENQRLLSTQRDCWASWSHWWSSDRSHGPRFATRTRYWIEGRCTVWTVNERPNQCLFTWSSICHSYGLKRLTRKRTKLTPMYDNTMHNQMRKSSGSMNEKTPGFCFSGFLIMMLMLAGVCRMCCYKTYLYDDETEARKSWCWCQAAWRVCWSQRCVLALTISSTAL